MFYVALAETAEGELAAIAFCYISYSTWEGRVVYLEDLYVCPAHRRSGLGTSLIQTVARAAQVAGCRRVQWQVLDWYVARSRCHREFKALKIVLLQERTGCTML